MRYIRQELPRVLLPGALEVGVLENCYLPSVGDSEPPLTQAH